MPGLNRASFLRGNMKIKTNNSNFVIFKKRNFCYAGDKTTWIKKDGDKLVVSKAKKGIISSSYVDEISAFLEQFGIDFSNIKAGEKVEISL